MRRYVFHAKLTSSPRFRGYNTGFGEKVIFFLEWPIKDPKKEKVFWRLPNRCKFFPREPPKKLTLLPRVYVSPFLITVFCYLHKNSHIFALNSLFGCFWLPSSKSKNLYKMFLWYNLMQWDGNSFVGDVSLERLEIASRGEDSILNNLYEKQIFLNLFFYIRIVNFWRDWRKCICILLQHS